MEHIRTVAVIGTGTIGASWSALFLAHGLDVRAYDPSPEAEARLRAFVSRALPDMRRQQQPPRDGQLLFLSTLEHAVAAADLVQENGPEREEVKVGLISQIEAAAPDHAIVASSTTAFPQSRIAAGARDPSRVIIAHPFNPPHLMPLVELVGLRPDAPAVLGAFKFYKRLGREPVILKAEAVGHLANRFQAAVMREALYCLEQGVADVEDIDRAVRFGPGLRWAFMGPFQTYHLAGGGGGIRHYFRHLGLSQVKRWESLGTPDLNDALKEKAIAGVEAMLGDLTTEELEAARDSNLKAVIAALRKLGT